MAINNFKTITIGDALVEVNQNGTVIKVDGKQINTYINKKSNTKPNSGSYYQCSIKGKSYLVHRLVALAWVPNINNAPYATHLDTNTTNNYYKNLAWGGQNLIVQNMLVAGRSYRTAQSDRANSKIAPEEVVKVVKRLKNGENLSSIATDYNTSDMSIMRIKNRYILKKLRKKQSIERMDEDDENEMIVEMFRNTNYTSDEIAEVKNLSRSQVEKIIRNYRRKTA